MYIINVYEQVHLHMYIINLYEQVPPAELESVLLSHPGIQDVAVLGVPDQEAGEVPKAFVVLKPGENLTPQNVMDFVKGACWPFLCECNLNTKHLPLILH